MLRNLLLSLLGVTLLAACSNQESNCSITLEYDFIQFLQQHSGTKTQQEPQIYALLEEAIAADSENLIDEFESIWNENFSGRDMNEFFKKRAYLPKVSQAELLNELRTDWSNSCQAADEIISKRIQLQDAELINVERVGDYRRTFNCIIPKNVSAVQLSQLIQTSADLGIWASYDNMDVYPFLSSTNDLLANLLSPDLNLDSMTEAYLDDDFSTPSDAYDSVDLDDLLLTEEPQKPLSTDELNKLHNPLWTLMVFPTQYDSYGSMVLTPGCEIGYVKQNDQDSLNKLLNYPEVQQLFPHDLLLAWSARCENDICTLYTLKSEPNGEPAVDGSSITSVRKEFDTYSRGPAINITFDQNGRSLLEDLTRNSLDQAVAITIGTGEDMRVYAAPKVVGVITTGEVMISLGPKNPETEALADELVSILSLGELPFPLEVIAVR